MPKFTGTKGSFACLLSTSRNDATLNPGDTKKKQKTTLPHLTMAVFDRVLAIFHVKSPPSSSHAQQSPKKPQHKKPARTMVLNFLQPHPEDRLHLRLHRARSVVLTAQECVSLSLTLSSPSQCPYPYPHCATPYQETNRERGTD